jgi:hypothetical protein
MNCVFSQTAQTQYWLTSSQVPNIELELDFDKWAKSSCRRVAMLEIQYFDPDTQTLVEQAIKHGDLVMLFVPEFISDQWCRIFDLPNVVFFLSGRLNWIPTHARVFDCFYFFWSTCDFYRTYPDLLNIPKNPMYYFDVLLGRQKAHRSIIHDLVDHNKNIVTYFPKDDAQDIRQYTQTEFIWPEDVLPKPTDPIDYTVQEVLVDGVIVSLSQIIPRKIYGRTAYSLVAETQNENSFSFFTEKIVKPILARRLFIVASGQHYLANLRSLGFKTFDGIIDESYDQEPNDFYRMKKLLDQVNLLQQLDPAVVARQIEPIVDHNFRVMMNTDWQGQLITQIRNLS